MYNIYIKMADEKLITIRDVSIALGVTEKEVIELAEKGEIPAYKIAGVYLRFKRHQVEEYRQKNKNLLNKQPSYSGYCLKERISDFLYFNDFYILSTILIVLIILVILRGY
ncbi:MAG: helix-turn-helix domain-containing protein [Candidatus Omnitrophica bacterium]|jgi:excisionase family DNA binding protein|nr:helix-turn-helix domain-containing protein [Candidatus Omnitrophota bacterium]